MKNLALVTFLFFSTFVFSQENPNLIPFKKSNLWGFADINGVIQIEAQYDSVDFFGQGRAKVWKRDNQGFINPQGENLVELIYQKTDFIYFGDQLFSAKKDQKWGVVNANKATLLAFEFDKIEFIGGPFLRVIQNGLYGVYKMVDGKFIKFASANYSKIEMDNYTEKYLFKGTLKNGDIEYLDKAGQLIKRISPNNKAQAQAATYEMEEVVEEEPPSASNTRIKYPQFTPINTNGKTGVVVRRESNNVHTWGQILSDTILGDFQEIITKHSFSDAYVVKQNDKWGAINLAGQTIIPVEYDSIDVKSMRFQGRSGQTFIVQKNGKWGVIGNANKFQKRGAPNEIKIPFQYDAIRRNVNNTFYIVNQNDKFGIVNAKNFELIAKPLYPQIKDTFRRVNKFAVFSIIMENGEVVFVGENGVEFFSE